MTDNNVFTLADSNIQLVAPRDDLDFFDQQSMPLVKRLSPLQAWGIIMSQPMPLLKLGFAIRDTIAALFGVKKIGGFTGGVPETVETGDKLDFFLVEAVSDDILTLTERDRHLDVMTCVSVRDDVLTITASVKTHNRFGRLYMIPVAPIHRRIVRKNLKQIAQSQA